MAGDRVRTFIAVEVDPAVQRALVALKHELAATGAAVRWTRDENLHATVKFLGGVDPARLAALPAALTSAVTATPPLPADVRGLGAFPSPKRPRVVWVGLHCPGLEQVAGAIDAALVPLGFAAESRRFVAHVTLGRVNGTSGLARLDAALCADRERECGASTIRELVGFRSDLRRDGAVYTKLWTIPFGG